MTRLHPLRQEAVQPTLQHADLAAYAAFVSQYAQTARARRHLLQARERFIAAYPQLHDWLEAPLIERVGRLYGQERSNASFSVSYEARAYLLFLARCGALQLGWNWLIASTCWELNAVFEQGQPDYGIDRLVKEAAELGYGQSNTSRLLKWAVYRLFLQKAISHVDRISEAHLQEFQEAVEHFAQRPECALLFGSAEQYLQHYHTSKLYLLRMVLYHRGLYAHHPG